MTRRWERRLAVLCAVSGVLLLAVAGTLWLLDQEMNRQLAYSLIAGVALLIGYAVLDASALTDLARTRRGRSGSISVLTTAVVLGLLVGINILASRGSQAADLSKAHLNTLAPQSVLVTKRLDADLNVIGFYRPTGADAQSRQDAQELLTLYANESRRVKVTFANPDLSPEEVQRYGVRTSGTLVLAFKGKTELLAPGSQGEQDVTSAILKLESERTPQLCWVGGDGERDLKEANQITGYSAAADILNRNNFKTRDLLLTAAVPADCDAVAVVGAQKPLTSDAQKFLAGYLAGGGKLLVAADPWLDGGTLDSLNQVAKPYGVSFDGGLVIDPDPAHNANDPRVPAAVRYGDSPITRGLASRISVLEDTTAVSADSSAGAMVTPIVTTSNQAYEVPSKRSNLTKQSGDKAGPFVLMETAEKEQSGKKTRIVLVGTSLFGANLAMPPQFPGVNTQLLVGSMEWLSEQDNLIALPPRASRVVPLALTAEQQGLVFLLTLLVMPALVACGGIWVWARRRYS